MSKPPEPYDFCVVTIAEHVLRFALQDSTRPTVGEVAKRWLADIDKAGLALVPKDRVKDQ